MKLRFFAAFLLIFALAFTQGDGFAKDAPNSNKVSKTKATLGKKGSPTYGLLNINNWQYFLEANGRSGVNPFLDGDGGIFPRGTSYVVFQDGFIFGGAMANAATGLPLTTERIRVGGQTYNIGTVAGAVINGVPENPNNPSVRLYRIRRDINDGIDLRQDAADFLNININEVNDADIAELKAQYLKDWDEWPVAKGAPYVDRNKNGRYDKPPAGLTSRQLIEQNLDEPGLAGADPSSPAGQVMWTACNDFNESQTRGLYGAAPIGVEIQITVWGYGRTDALGNVLFKKFRLLNKGTLKSDTMYVCQWSDADLGDFGDDFTGCDVSQVGGKPVSLGFVYNSNSVDREFRKFNIPPPSGGYDFFQGPLVAGAATDVGIFDLKKRPGFTNLGMSSFNYFSAGSAISDPPLTQYEGALRWWKMLRGFIADPSTSPNRRWVDPQGNPTFYPLAGDPVARTGWIDGSAVGTPAALPPGDRRFLLVSGPFKFAPGDTQEVVVGVVAGLGADRLSSISVMKFSDRFAQNTYDALFAVPSPPRAPTVAVRELDGEIVLDWGSQLSDVDITENNNSAPYAFQGYNVYQLPNRNATARDGKRLATFDVIDEVTVVLDDQFDPTSGQILRLPVQLGSNSGINRSFRVTADAVSGRPRLRNGQEYYFGVTAYSVSSDPGATPVALESSMRILAATPQSPKPGIRYEGAYGQALAVKHSAGVSDGTVTTTVVDPGKATGATYKVSFRTDAQGHVQWVLNRSNQEIFSAVNQGPIQSGDPNDEFNYPTIDGLYIVVSGPPAGMKEFQITGGERRITFANGNFGLEGFSGAIGLASLVTGFFDRSPVTPDKARNVVMRHAGTDVNGTVTNPNDPDWSYAYRYLRGATAPPARPEFAPFIKNATAGYAFQEFAKSIPWAAYDMESNPPRRLAVGHLENNVAGGTVNGKWWPPESGSGVDNVAAAGPREWFFIFDVNYSETPDPALQGNILGSTFPIMWFGTPGRRGSNVSFLAEDEFLIVANHINTTADAFEFTAPAQAAFNATTAATDVQKVNVFPNPYYAINSAETSRFVRFVTFNFLPARATIRIFNVAGQLVRILEKDDESQFMRWDLNNANNFPVASGMYIAHINMPGVGATKVLKLAVIQEQEVLEVF